MKLFKSIAYITVIVTTIFLIGCASPANYLAMSVEPTGADRLNPKLIGTIVVTRVFGGEKTSPLWQSKVDNDAFRKALENSLNAYGYLASSFSGAKYKLDAGLLSLDQPIIGFNLEVESAVTYKISGAGIDKKYPIKTVGTAKVSDALLAGTRLKIANERSIQKNIKEFLHRLNYF